MIQLRSVLKPADNSGAKALMVIGIPGSNKKIAYLIVFVLFVGLYVFLIKDIYLTQFHFYHYWYRYSFRLCRHTLFHQAQSFLIGDGNRAGRGGIRTSGISGGVCAELSKCYSLVQ